MVPKTPSPPWLNVVANLKKRCQAVLTRNEQPHVQSTFNKSGRGAILSPTVFKWKKFLKGFYKIPENNFWKNNLS